MRTVILPHELSEWEVVLLVDVREKGHEFLVTWLSERGVQCEVAQLALGDFMWAARPIAARGPRVEKADTASASGTARGAAKKSKVKGGAGASNFMDYVVSS